MSGISITDLPVVNSSQFTDVIPIVQTNTTSQASLLQVSNLFGFSAGILAILSGGTGVSSVTTSPTASAWAAWNSESNLRANSFLSGYTTTVTSAGTTTLTVSSAYYQYFTGSTTQTVVLPVTSTLVLGQSFFIVNNSSGQTTIQSSGLNTIQVMDANTTILVTCILTSGTGTASWNAIYNSSAPLTLPLSLANGGTNNSLTASAGGILWSDASQINILAGTATAGLLLISGSSATPAWLATANNGALVTSGAGVPSISSTLPTAVQSNITSLGTISSIGAPLGLSFGGTNKNMTPSAGGIVWTDSDSMEVIAGNANAGKLLRSGALAAPTWTTATYPSVVSTSGTIIMSDGSNFANSVSRWPNTVGSGGQIIRSNGTQNLYSTSSFANTYTINNILYASAANDVNGLATANNGVLVTSNTGVPSILAGPGTTGNILQSNAAAAPSFSTATYPSVAGTSGNVMVSNGTNFVSSAKNFFNSYSIQIITATGTYTPTAGSQFFRVEICGGGGGAGAISGGTAGNAALSSGGGGSGYSMRIYNSTEMGANASVTIGAAGAGGTAGGGGAPGGTTTFDPAGTGATITATGGGGGTGMLENVTMQIISGGTAGTGSGGNVNITGTPGNGSMVFAAAAGVYGGAGGGSHLGEPGFNQAATSGGDNGSNNGNYGSGATGRFSIGAGGSSGDGSAGVQGVAIITEFVTS